MGNTNSDQLEDLLYKAHELGILSELRNRVSNQPELLRHTPNSFLERYESCFRQIIKEGLQK